jgi:hypothetical protein
MLSTHLPNLGKHLASRDCLTDFFIHALIVDYELRLLTLLEPLPATQEKKTWLNFDKLNRVIHEAGINLRFLDRIWSNKIRKRKKKLTQ